MKAKASAVVEVRVRLDLADAWGEDCTIGQAMSQAKAEALRVMREKFKDKQWIHVLDVDSVSIIIKEQ